MMTDKKIGWIGLGLMGIPMCQRLLAAGFSLHVWNRHPEKAADLVSKGAHLADSPSALAAQCEIVMLCVSDTAAVESVVLGEKGVLSGLKSGTVIVDFSSISPAATRVLAKKTQTAGGHWVDCPVSGGVVGAQSGELVMMAGGEAAQIEALRPVLAPLAQRVTHMGKNGTGQVTKVCNQLIVAANAALIAEAVNLAQGAGVKAELLAPALAGGFADSKPFQLLAPRMALGTFEPVQWKVKTLLKDLNNAIELGDQADCQVPMATLAGHLLEEHAETAAEQDLSSLIQLYKN